MAAEKVTTPTVDNTSPGISPAAGAVDEADVSKVHATIIDGARAAATKERNMTLMQGLRLYPKAVAWSVLISTCIAMEGYDISLVSNFCKSLALAITRKQNRGNLLWLTLPLQTLSLSLHASMVNISPTRRVVLVMKSLRPGRLA
jgi:SP family general alpha glucoside:H+ symporter-like MFS transporter